MVCYVACSGTAAASVGYQQYKTKHDGLFWLRGLLIISSCAVIMTENWRQSASQ